MGDIARQLIDIINPNAKIVQDEQRIRPEKSEVNRLLGSNAKIKKLTAWTPQYSLKDGLKETVEFFEKNLSRYKAELYNI